MMLWESFDKNEIYILIVLIVVYSIFFLLPKKFPRHITLLLLVWGFAGSTFFDFTIGGGMVDFYKVNDTNRYELFDLITYFMFAPISYFFIYTYEILKIDKKTFIWFIIGWSILGLGAERISTLMDVTNYQHGYKQAYSITVFLVMQTLTALYYELIKSNRNKVRV